MKFRTDFVTNSSSSNFMVTVTVVTKNGESYCFEKGDMNGETYNSYDFHGDLFGMMKDNAARRAIDECVEAIERFEPKSFEKVLLKETNNSASEIEKIHKGDLLVLVPRKKDWDIFLDVFYEGIKIGEFPKSKGYGLGRWIQSYATGDNAIGTYVAKVVEVTPLSKQKTPTSPKVYVEVELTVKDYTIPERGLNFDSVESLCNYLVENVYDGYRDGDSEDYDEEEEFSFYDAESFVECACEEIKSVSDIEKIIVEREWYAWGEGADLFAENDDRLCELARDVVSASNDQDKRLAIQAMKDYINSDEYADEMYGESGFGDGCDFHYVLNGDDEDLEEIAERLCSNYGPDDAHGVEHHELNVLTSETKSDAYFDLK